MIPAPVGFFQSGETESEPITTLVMQASTISTGQFDIGGSEAKDGEVNAATNLYVAWKVYIASPANAAIDMVDEGSNILQSGFIAVSHL